MKISTYFYSFHILYLTFSEFSVTTDNNVIAIFISEFPVSLFVNISVACIFKSTNV